MPQSQVPASTRAEKLVGMYIALRDELRRLNEAHKLAIEKHVEYMEECKGRLQHLLEVNGAESMKTSMGTVYETTKFTATLPDPKAFMDFVIANNEFDLLDRKANVTAVRGYVNDHGALPPGCHLASIKDVGVRSPTKK